MQRNYLNTNFINKIKYSFHIKTYVIKNHLNQQKKSILNYRIIITVKYIKEEPICIIKIKQNNQKHISIVQLLIDYIVKRLTY